MKEHWLLDPSITFLNHGSFGATPIASADEVIASVLERVTPRTRLLIIDHITSQTALIIPVAQIVAEMNARGIDTLIDGAHAPGMLPLDIRSIGAAYYTANLHKWV